MHCLSILIAIVKYYTDRVAESHSLAIIIQKKAVKSDTISLPKEWKCTLCPHHAQTYIGSHIVAQRANILDTGMKIAGLSKS